MEQDAKAKNDKLPEGFSFYFTLFFIWFYKILIILTTQFLVFLTSTGSNGDSLSFVF